MNKFESSLKTLAVKGSVHLTIRRTISIALNILGALLITRIVGPEIYGLYNAAYGIFTFLLPIALMGMNIYLIRETDISSETIDAIFWWLVFFSFFIVIASMPLFMIATIYWIGEDKFFFSVAIFLLCIPITVSSYVPFGIMERKFEYKKVASCELISQTVYYACAIPLAWKGHGIYALLIGFFASQIVLFAMAFVFSRYTPRWGILKLRNSQLTEALKYGASQAASGWVHNLRQLAPSLILLPLLGGAAAGYWALANRLLNIVSFTKATLERVSVPVFSKVKDDRQKFARTTSLILSGQVISLGIILSLFSICIPTLLPRLIGYKWNTNTILIIYAILSVRVLLASITSILSISLQIKGQNLLVTKTALVQTVLFFMAGYTVSTYTQNTISLYVFALVDLLSHLPSLWILYNRGIKPKIAEIEWRILSLWLLAVTLAIVTPLFGWWLYIICGLLILNPFSLRHLEQFYNLVKHGDSIHLSKHTKV
ncbi:oligosaccharide flippase family protein, partial [Fischerella thermalis]